MPPVAARRRTGARGDRQSTLPRGGLFWHVAGHPLPNWAGKIDCANWAQFFLKFIVSRPAVTCAIPAASQVEHMHENMGALRGRLPDQEMRQRMIRYVEGL